MRVLHVSGCFAPATEWGGVVTAVAGMAAAGRAAGIEGEVFTTTQRSSPALPRIEPGTRVLEGTPVSWFGSIHAGGRGFVAPGLWRALRRRAREFDLVHLHMLWTFPGMAAGHVCRKAGVPYVVSPHGALDPHALTQRGLEKRIFLLFGERRSLERAALVVFATEAERESAPSWVRARPSAVVPNVVDAPEPLPRDDAHEVLILGRIHPIKGFDVLAPAMKEVLAADPRVRLVVAGPDEAGHLALVRALFDAHGLREVRFAGQIGPRERAEAFSRAALLVAPSYQENFGMAVAEAMAAGVPVVVSEKVNLAPEISAAGAGLVAPLDSGRFAQAMLALLRDADLRARMGAAGRKLVLGKYAPAAVGARLRAAYEAATRRA